MGETLVTIGKIYTDFPDKFGIPRQSGLIESLEARIIFEPEFRVPEAFRGLEGFSHIWLLWGFSETEKKRWYPTVRPPRLGGNRRMGVFATRSPFRPNAVGLSCVRLDHIEFGTKDGPVLHVLGADLMDQTPIYDIKPYLPITDCRQEAESGFAEQTREYSLQVEFPEELLANIEERHRESLISILSHDPRPSYQKDAERVYGMRFADYEIRFTVSEGILTVRQAEHRRG
ncbi:MAG: tRNA (N6-threonylcarbamoyladenosine(37)-N6)-methyltransferase TrmO [Lachnospiraceae bacterium]|jgi:tRNA-Thr(GGU) m(6)t(6)A37 methyltransferase TsaA|nr:tRNA (N6-threonylcarbamoyladenosine(37)-N6)-methyltransferase TrmO [Lachnospiraceae bacterium]NBJ80832.1 tRNA (N6-threonylcarbamoyladenosine(37)-N6)-methyltransferase TrmO [bacterium 1XD42-76]NBK04041.1 tRNA (N6-threonylcarbamoyladenosine(37)-N6)-methyltransferase TrmO [bacterium 1XD42-94]